MEIGGKEIRFKGSLIRIAYIDGEGYQFLDDPESTLELLRKSGTRADLFTFIQKISETTPKYSYPMELDNTAALPISTFDEWMTHQINFKERNKVRKSAKNGVVVREVPFDDDLLRGIQTIYSESPIRQGRRFWHYGKDVEALRGFKRIQLPSSYIPLTAIGRMAFRLGLHHGATDWIPESAIAKYRSIRRHWYAKRFPGIDNA